MLEFRFDDASYKALNDGKPLMARGEADSSPIERICSGAYKELTTYHIITHIMTKWGYGKREDIREEVLVPFSLGSSAFPCSSGNFSNNGADYVFNTFFAKICAGEDYIHRSDVMCSVLEGRFSVSTKEGFQAKLEDHVKMANALYTRFYEQGKAPRVTLRFEEVENRNSEFQCVKDNHSRRDDKPEVVEAGDGDNERVIAYGRKFMEINWNDIGGLFIPKKQVREFLDDFYDPESAFALGLNPRERGGVFLFGDTGNGKTLFAEAVATELKLKYGNDFVPFFVDYSHLQSIFRGGETGRTHEMFSKVNYLVSQGKKVLFFIDEAQSIAQRSECARNRHINEALDQLLVETSRFDYGQCILMAATAQDPSTIDQQLMRPGRFGTHVFFNTPLEKEAFDILQKGVEKRVEDSRYGRSRLVTRRGINYEKLVEQTNGFTLADLYYLVRDVFRSKLGEFRNDGKFSPVKTSDFDEPIQQRRVSKSKTMSCDAVI